MAEIKIGNKYILDLPVVDADGVAVTDLATATEVWFMIKNLATDADADALVTKTLTASGGIEVDTPVEGTIRVTLDSPSTKDIIIGEQPIKSWGCEVVYSPTNSQEVFIKENHKIITTVKLLQDVVRGA